MTDEVLAFQPTAQQQCYTFGGHEPLAHIRPGQLLELNTEDCFGGLVGRGTTDRRWRASCRLSIRSPGHCCIKRSAHRSWSTWPPRNPYDLIPDKDAS
jgi:hypothetical protein